MDKSQAVLDYLRSEGNGFVSGQELAGVLGVSRNAVWKTVVALRRADYAIEARPRKGYRLVAAPDVPRAEEVLPAGSRLFHQVEYLPETRSTNDRAKEQARAGAAEGTLIVADKQTAGRGRRGRRWASPAGKGLWFSLILRPHLAPRHVPLLALLAAAAGREAIEDEAGLSVLIKWPNDLVFSSDEKVCGILAELDAELDQVCSVILGVGINVNQVARDFPPELRGAAGSLRLGGGRPLRRVILMRRFLEVFESRYTAVQAEGFESVLAEARQHSATVGRPVRVVEGERSWEGKAVDIQDDGALLVRPAGGGLPRAVYSGDVSVRPAPSREGTR